MGRSAARVKSGLAFLLVTAWTVGAAASTSFPSAVDEHLKLTGALTVENAYPPTGMGCLLCHVTPVGGFGTNNTFGTKLREKGAVGAVPSTVGPALDALAQVDPRAIDDLMMGINPNDDPEDPVHPLPQPEYGCAMNGAPSTNDAPWALALLALAAVAGSRRRTPRPDRHRSQ
jgi:MYXO-CTERM domain-containing protein